MPRKLKTFQTSLGFYDLAIAAPSMKAALEAWGAGSNLFHQGFATETHDPAVIAAAMARPGVVLKRPAGSNRRFAEQSDLPTDLGVENGARKKATSPNKRLSPRISDENARSAAAEFEREEKRRDAERRREEATREKERAKRERAVAKARAALDEAQRKHCAVSRSRARRDREADRGRRHPLAAREAKAVRSASCSAGLIGSR
ncbi:colicin import membrane protein [Bradyrhizobium diazoefficiens]|jgi:hypothetical protein|uniref:Colicin import membrane protein n=2 Tax=Bradyrhizobium TaxID=374 RepID=A0ABV4FIF1_9BRAD|nr:MULTISPECIES: cell envelope biogenesis protein TolA [Bradyrhizobium]MCP1768383.1 hypothetical protein [Bradyrhizobium japonicum]MCP1794544.1 hypothetical protein [Bradyrhizobium japonicum]MCP1811190.1 hypothetical protein [Bradyrhizobium japonicum]MCP1821445.1 hypothetical protein [Bradyrhizobium japonicum]MCP1875993.1 hypothetical protein [Bradyrhizobium japonicum]